MSYPRGARKNDLMRLAWPALREPANLGQSSDYFRDTEDWARERVKQMIAEGKLDRSLEPEDIEKLKENLGLK